MRYTDDLSAAERGRLLDLVARLRAGLTAGALFLAVAVAVAVPTFGAIIAAPLAAAGAGAWLAARRMGRSERPDLILALAWAWAQAMMTVTVVLAQGPSLYLLALFVFPVLLSNVFASRGVALLAATVTIALMLLTGVLADAGTLWAQPFAFVYPAGSLLAMTLLAPGVREADVASRRAAVADALTGVPNRLALEARVAEITAQAALHPDAVTVLVADLDRFKLINDVHGHATGDAVLVQVAQRLTATAGRATAVYRLGGEEFVVVLTRATADDGQRMAERLCAAIRAAPVAGVPVTISVGVATTPPGAAFDYATVFAHADTALYASKHAGRDRVTVAVKPVLDPAEASRLSEPAPAPPVIHAAVADRSPSAGDERRPGWLLGDDLERRHLLDLALRLHVVSRPCYLVSFAVIFAAAPTYGWITLVPSMLAAVAFELVFHHLGSFRRPERAYVTAWLSTLAVNGLALILMRSATDETLYALPMLAIMISCTSAVLPRRGAVLGIGWASLAAGIGALAGDPSRAEADPGVVALGMSLVVFAGLVGASAGRSSLSHRGAAVVDRLTGMLNRAALAARVAELSQQVTGSEQEVSLIVADIDRFKSVNDEYGHDVGDRVLQETAYRMRKHLRAFEAVYRIGGEEFAVLLPGMGADEARTVAVRLCGAVRESAVLELPVTISAGVATCASELSFDFETTYARADAALYDAKRGGRDQVRRAGDSPAQALQPA